jgi:hypothetical protein
MRHFQVPHSSRTKAPFPWAVLISDSFGHMKFLTHYMMDKLLGVAFPLTAKVMGEDNTLILIAVKTRVR